MGARPLVVGVADLRRQPGSRRRLQRTVALDGLAISSARVPDGAEIGLDLELEALSNGLVATGTLTVPWEGECRRCLRDVRSETGSPASAKRTASRSARRQTVRARCRAAPAGVPAGRTKVFRSGSWPFMASISASSRATWLSAMRRAEPAASSALAGVERSAPRSNISFWIRVSMTSSSPVAWTRARPRQALVSSTAP